MQSGCAQTFYITKDELEMVSSFLHILNAGITGEHH